MHMYIPGDIMYFTCVIKCLDPSPGYEEKLGVGLHWISSAQNPQAYYIGHFM